MMSTHVLGPVMATKIYSYFLFPLRQLVISSVIQTSPAIDTFRQTPPQHLRTCGCHQEGTGRREYS